MIQTRDDIEQDIESTRQSLRSDLQELERRARHATDWREQFRNRSAVMLGLAFGGGLILASLVGRPRSAPAARAPVAATTAPRGTGQHSLVRALESTVAGAMAASSILETLARVVPALQTHFAAGSRGAANDVQGEGDYRAARRYRASAERYAHSADVEAAARQAAPKNPAEAASMAQAEAIGRARAKLSDA